MIKTDRQRNSVSTGKDVASMEREVEIFLFPPVMETLPLSRLHSPINPDIRVLFPDPVEPHTATRALAGNRSDTFFSTVTILSGS